MSFGNVSGPSAGVSRAPSMLAISEHRERVRTNYPWEKLTALYVAPDVWTALSGEAEPMFVEAAKASPDRSPPTLESFFGPIHQVPLSPGTWFFASVDQQGIQSVHIGGKVW